MLVICPLFNGCMDVTTFNPVNLVAGRLFGTWLVGSTLLKRAKLLVECKAQLVNSQRLSFSVELGMLVGFVHLRYVCLSLGRVKRSCLNAVVCFNLPRFIVFCYC